MKWIFFVFMLTPWDVIGASYEWSEWFSSEKCFRRCADPAGVLEYRRYCFNCSSKTDSACRQVNDRYCPGKSAKNDSCYVATLCEGDGIFIGQWTEWLGSRSCPPPADKCQGVMVERDRKCFLPDAYPERGRRFQCPDMNFFRRTEFCPCETSQWSAWSAWSACADPCGTRASSRRRVCTAQRNSDCDGASIDTRPCPTDPSRCNDATLAGLVKRQVSIGWDEKRGQLERIVIEPDGPKPSKSASWVFPTFVILFTIAVACAATIGAMTGKFPPRKKAKGDDEDSFAHIPLLDELSWPSDETESLTSVDSELPWQKPAAPSPKQSTPQHTTPTKVTPSSIQSKVKAMTPSPKLKPGHGTPPKASPTKATAKATPPKATPPKATPPKAAASPKRTPHGGTSPKSTPPKGISPKQPSHEKTSPKPASPRGKSPKPSSQKVTTPKATPPKGTSPTKQP